MTDETTSLARARSIDDLFSATPDGAALLRMLRRLGFWVDREQGPSQRIPYERDVSELSADDLMDLYSYWVSERGRAVEIVGALRGQEHRAKERLARVRSERAKAIFDEHAADGKAKPTGAQLDALLGSDPQVQRAEEPLTQLRMLIASVDGVRDSIEGYTTMLSRRITQQEYLAKARL